MRLSRIVKKIMVFILTLAFALPTAITFAQQPISVAINGQPVIFQGQQPVLVNGRTLVPVRGVFEHLGFDVEWNGALQQVTLTRTGQTVILTIGQAGFTTVTSYAANHTLDVPAQIINASTMLPIRAVIEAVGYSLAWDGANQTVQITRPTQPQQPNPSEQVQGDISVVVNGRNIDFRAVNLSRELMVVEEKFVSSVRVLAEALVFGHRQASGVLTIYRWGQEITFPDGESYFMMNGIRHDIPEQTQLYPDSPSIGIDRAMIPTQIVLEAMGYAVDWDLTTRTVFITRPVFAPITITRNGETKVRADETGVHILGKVLLTQEEIQSLIPYAKTREETRMSPHPERQMTAQELIAWNQEYDDLGGMNVFELEILYFVNRQRHENGLPSLTLYPNFNRASRLIVNLMADGHMNQDHFDPFYGGPNSRYRIFNPYTRGGLVENLGGGSNRAGAAENLVNGWMGSGLHRRAILTEGVKPLIGVGSIAGGTAIKIQARP